MSEHENQNEHTVAESSLQSQGPGQGGTFLSPPPFQLNASIEGGAPLQLEEGDPVYLRTLGANPSNEEIMQTEEFKSLMREDLVWQTDYNLSYEQSLNICRHILPALAGGGRIDWEREARRYVEGAIRQPGREETQAVGRDIGNATIEAIVAAFTTQATAASTLAELRTLVSTKGQELWEASKTIAVPGANDADTPVYWARIQMRNVLRDHDVFNTSANLRHLNPLLESLEQTSRGMEDITWPEGDSNLKRILVTGFDPFGGGTSNPSGIIATRLDGMRISYGDNEVAVCQGVTFPVRYNEFDDGMVESFAGPLLNDPEQNIFMVMTISLYGGNDYIHLDRFASRHREGHADNSGITSNGTPEVLPEIGQGDDPQFIESNFPLAEMLADPNMPANVAVRQDGEYSENGTSQTFNGGDDTVSPADYRPYAEGTTTTNPLPPIPSGDITAESGPGGDYLSNEIFYRMSVLARSVEGREIPNVHLHIPRVGDSDAANGNLFDIDSILSSARQTLGVAVQNQMNP